ncbi:MAG: hypothetical protein QHC40_04990 [Sphingobium sp.]|nr:hypothetical protein [Sphingobium sp.]
MLKCALPVISALFCLSAASVVHASGDPEEADAGAWTMSDAGVRVAAAGIAAPTTAASLSLQKTGEISNGGKSIDNYAQYVSEDGAIQATLYIYLPTYADAALGAYMTDRAIAERFGNRTRRTAYDSVAAAGRPGTAIRAVYDDAAEGELTTAAAFVHAGRWMVKLRVTGPSARRGDVTAGIDALLAGLHVDAQTPLHAAMPPVVGACPAASTVPARPFSQESARSTDGEARAPGFPRDGQDALCVRGRVDTAEGSYDILQAAGAANGSILIPMDDAGTVMAFDPVEGAADRKGGYRLSIHSVGRTDIYTAYDRLPSASQMAAILTGSDPAATRIRSTTAYAANGDRSVTPGGR